MDPQRTRRGRVYEVVSGQQLKFRIYKEFRQENRGEDGGDGVITSVVECPSVIEGSVRGTEARPGKVG